MENDGDYLMMNYLVNSDILELEGKNGVTWLGCVKITPNRRAKDLQQAWNIYPGMGVEICWKRNMSRAEVLDKVPSVSLAMPSLPRLLFVRQGVGMSGMHAIPLLCLPLQAIPKQSTSTTREHCQEILRWLFVQHVEATTNLIKGFVHSQIRWLFYPNND
jgi:hypothetical protein